MKTKTAFQVGDRIKLKNYSGYGDWSSHDNQVAVVTKILTEFDRRGFTHGITWEDGATSHVSEDNIILMAGDWDS